MAAETQMVLVRMPDGATFKVNPRDLDAWLETRGGEVVGGLETKVEEPAAKPKRVTAKKDAAE